MLEGHDELVRCIRFDNKRIISGAYDGKIKVWDLEAALDPKTKENTLCVKTLVEHTGRVFRLQFDQFQIVSSSHDDTILIWDFLDSEAGNFNLPAFRRGGNSSGNSSNNGNSSNTNGDGAKLKHNSLSNGSTNGFGSLSTNGQNLDNHMESSAPNTAANFFKTDFFGHNNDKPMQSSSTSSINKINQLDQEMTNSNEFQAEFPSALQHSPVNSSNENQAIEIMDTQKIEHQQKEFNLSSPSISNPFSNFLISQSGSTKQAKLANITNLTNLQNSTNSTDNQAGDLAINHNLNSPNVSDLSNNLKGIPSF